MQNYLCVLGDKLMKWQNR